VRITQKQYIGRLSCSFLVSAENCRISRHVTKCTGSSGWWTTGDETVCRTARQLVDCGPRTAVRLVSRIKRSQA